MGIGWSVHKNDGWRGRVLDAANKGSSDLEDFTFSLFQNCYHLLEWFQKTAKADSGALNTVFNQSRELQLCRDICNGTKHMTLRRASVDACPSLQIVLNYVTPVKRVTGLLLR